MNKNLYINDDDDEFSFNNITSIIKYIKNHFISFLLLLVVLFIIFIVDHISNINSIIFSFPSPVIGLTDNKNKSIMKTKIKIPKKKFIKK